MSLRTALCTLNNAGTSDQPKRALYWANWSALLMLFMLVVGCDRDTSFDTKSHSQQILPPSPTVATPSQSSSQTDVIGETVRELIRQGWSEDSARAVAEFNGLLLKVAWETDRDQWKKIVDLWGRLGSKRSLQEKLREMPEYASLLAGVHKAGYDGELIIETILKHWDDRQAISNLYLLFCEPDDALMLAKALQREGKLILRLYNKAGLHALPWLLKEPPNDEAGRVYQRWVRQVFEDALDRSARGDDDALDSACVLLEIHSQVVLELLRKDHSFQENFLDSYWPKFVKTLEEKVEYAETAQERHLLWPIYAADERVWQYYHHLRDKGDDVYHVFDRYGCVAVELMLAPEYRELREEVFSVLHRNDEMILQGLADDRLRKERLFVELLKRNLPSWALAAAIQKLLAQPGEIPKRLSYWQRLSNDALLQDLGPPEQGPQTWIPGYGVYYLFHKWFQGRELDVLDYFGAGVDLISIVPVARATAVTEGVLKTMARKGASELAQQGVKGAFEKAGARAVAPFLAKESYQLLRKPVTKAAAGLAVIDITPGVRHCFRVLQALGVGRKSFKYLTGLEARVFMRSDRYVVLDLSKLFSSSSTFGRVLRLIAENAAFDSVMQTPLAENVAREVVWWRKYVSAWWTAVHTGAVDLVLKGTSQANTMNTGH